ncbi:conserved protein of unknown function (plasmid) [Rhodovastum atsumiense]|uniref:Helix-turn-helix domain-containing protein n=1 Tax=Rhodovastum atsumiense TaxID=504468 RepID=A0A5M6INP8_9PROT|nr:hypothetical protein [Rhodovastum atsumiense]KAA5609607.1 hypothetical protein F1189_23570 [Rhodovastum atsumiense]CAH2606374.1 conserved protein of unknown function [Rhodovastum atsumiense]
MLAISSLAPLFPGFTAPKTYAAYPVWADSTTKTVKFVALSKKAAVRLYHRARDFDRRTHEPGKHGGVVGRTALAVLHALLFDFLNYRTGRLDPSWQALAFKAGVAYSSVGRALKRLKALGMLFWLRRCTETHDADGRFLLKQDTNAYAVLPESQWLGYVAPPAPPPPAPGTWGDHPPLPDALTAAMAEQRHGGTLESVVRALESEPDNGVAAILARLGRAVQKAESGKSSGLSQ